MMIPTPGEAFGGKKPVESNFNENDLKSEFDTAAFLRAIGATAKVELAAPAAAEATNDQPEVDDARDVNTLSDHSDLPINAYLNEITDAVNKNQVVIIAAETGAGKSTQVPQALAEEGYQAVVTQPRVMAARNVASRISDEYTAKYGNDCAKDVGYRTANEGEGDSNCRILAVTDGLQVVRELVGKGTGEKQVLVLDEVHEWNENMEVLVAWSKKRMKEDPNFKVVVMSATMETGSLSRYFADEDGQPSPVIEVPGRTYNVEKRESEDSIADEAIKFAKDGKNTLVFVPGKAEIESTIAKINAANIPNATVLPLHGQMERSEQQKVFQNYDGAKIVVATNVAETSITIPDIDAVVDSGFERQMQVKNGVDSLVMNPISKANCLQRAGRAGRVKEGEYVLAKLDRYAHISFDRREEFGKPEILRSRLDGTILRLAAAGFDVEDIELYNVEKQDEAGKFEFKRSIERAKNSLTKLGALNEDGTITKIGRTMERMPVDSHYARMMVEARKYSADVRSQLAALLAVQEANGICQFSSMNRPVSEGWRMFLSRDYNDSDPIKQLEVFIAAQSISKNEMYSNGIHRKAFSRASEIMRKLRRVEKLEQRDLSVPDKEQREQLVKCIVAGMVDNLYVRKTGFDSTSYVNSQGDVRDMNKRALISAGRFVVGLPFDLQTRNRYGLVTYNLLQNVTNVPSIDVLREVAPQLFEEKSLGVSVTIYGKVVKTIETWFDGMRLASEDLIAAPGKERQQAVAHYLATQNGSLLKEVNRELTILSNKSGRSDIPKGLDWKYLERIILESLPEDTTIMPRDFKADSLPKITITEVLDQATIDEINKTSPDNYASYDLEYVDGVPFVTGLSEEQAVQLPDALALPDGREIKASLEGRAVSLQELRKNTEMKQKVREQNQKLQELREAVLAAGTEFSELEDRRYETLLKIDDARLATQPESRLAAIEVAEKTVDAFMQEIEDRRANIERKKALREQATKEGVPQEITHWRRWGGATGQSRAWVVAPDGRLIEKNSRTGGRECYKEGYETWDKNLEPGVIAVAYEKEFTRAQHQFKVLYKPEELTDEQRATIGRLEEEIAEIWRGTAAPPVGSGWGLKRAKKARQSSAGPESMAEKLRRLQERFNG